MVEGCWLAWLHTSNPRPTASSRPPSQAVVDAHTGTTHRRGVAVLAATLGLWAYQGTAVFFEMLRAGWIACF